jgi:glycosyltransferase involved in cell wall biosynthesis
LIDSLARLARQGHPMRATFVGEGRHKAELVQQVARVGLAEYVAFVGENTRGKLLERLDRADLFVMASRTEGMPRALLEAMARALPCVTTSVGGMPEVVAQADMVPPQDPRALATKLMEVLSTATRLSEMSRRNLNTARTFGSELLRQRHRQFHLQLKLRTSEWHNAQRA